MDAREKSGWTVVAGGVLINLMLGVTYTWSVFAGPLRDEFGWSQTEVQLAFSVMLAVFALAMIPAGWLQDRLGPRRVALAGGVLLGAGFVATSLFATSPFMLYLTYGVLAGAGVGLAYCTPIAAGVKWFEGKRGLVSGIIVFGFGFGSLLLAPLATNLIIARGISTAFLALGVLLSGIICIGALLLRNPPESKAAGTYTGVHPFRMVGTMQFWLLWVMFAFSAAAGLMVIGNLATFAKLSFTSVHGMADKDAVSLAALAVGVLGVFNGAGRILAGWISDKAGRRVTMLAFFGAQAFLVSGIVYAGGLSPFALFACMALVGLCFGSNFSLFPSATADFFGTKHAGANYGFVFTAYGVGGIIGPQVMAYLLDAAKSSAGTLSVGAYGTPFLVAGVLVGTAALLSVFTMKPPSGSDVK